MCSTTDTAIDYSYDALKILEKAKGRMMEWRVRSQHSLDPAALRFILAMNWKKFQLPLTATDCKRLPLTDICCHVLP